MKSTYDFRIRSPLPVVASGIPTSENMFKRGENGESLLYTFKQEIPIPSYLFAIASGDLASASIGPRSIVVTGPEELSGAKWELENDMEHFLEVAESIVFPYGESLSIILSATLPFRIHPDRMKIASYLLTLNLCLEHEIAVTLTSLNIDDLLHISKL